MDRNNIISPYGRSSFLKSALLALFIGIAGMFLPAGLNIAVTSVSTVFLLFTAFFFRDPCRESPSESNAVLAPADGTIVIVRETDHPFTGKSSTLVSIFMSPLNVHVNRIPISGKVVHLQYRQGKYLMAFDERSMSDNEKMEIGIERGVTKVLFCQVSGFLARRIVCDLKINQTVTAGSRFGMIKFGSRIDIYLPAGISIKVQKGMKTFAGNTVLGRY